MSIAVTKANFEQEVLQSDLPVLVDFWAYWCGPCMAQTPILNEIIMERPNQMKICKVNIDTDLRLAMTAEVRKFIAENPAEFDPRKYLGPGRDAIQAMVQHKIKNVLNASHTL